MVQAEGPGEDLGLLGEWKGSLAWQPAGQSPGRGVVRAAPWACVRSGVPETWRRLNKGVWAGRA